MGKKKQKAPERPPVGAMDVVLSIVAIIFLAGIRTFARPCTHADASPAACAFAGKVLLGLAIAALALVLMRLMGADRRTKRSFDLLLLVVGVFIAALPGTRLALCADATMACRIFMAPFSRVMGVLLGLAAIACEATVDRDIPTGRRRRR